MQRLLRSGSATLLLFALPAAIFAGCSGGEFVPVLPEDEQRSGTLVLENVRTRVFSEDRLESVLQATRAEMDLAQQQVDLSLVDVSVRDNEEEVARLQANRGLMFLKSQPDLGVEQDDFVLAGDVGLTDPNGRELHAPRIHYDASDGKIRSDGGWFEQLMPMKGNMYVMKGERFEVDRRLTHFVGYGAELSSAPSQSDSATSPSIGPGENLEQQEPNQ